MSDAVAPVTVLPPGTRARMETVRPGITCAVFYSAAGEVLLRVTVDAAGSSGYWANRIVSAAFPGVLTVQPPNTQLAPWAAGDPGMRLLLSCVLRRRGHVYAYTHLHGYTWRVRGYRRGAPGTPSQLVMDAHLRGGVPLFGSFGCLYTIDDADAFTRARPEGLVISAEPLADEAGV